MTDGLNSDNRACMLGSANKVFIVPDLAVGRKDPLGTVGYALSRIEDWQPFP